MTLDEVVRLVPEKRRQTLKRVLTPRWEAILKGLESHCWHNLDAARVDLRLDYRQVYLIRSALRLSGLLSWQRPFALATDDTHAAAPTQQTRLFTATKEGFRYAR
jgi:hypothetical protein